MNKSIMLLSFSFFITLGLCLVDNRTLPFNSFTKQLSATYNISTSGSYVSIEFQSISPILTNTVVYATLQSTSVYRPSLNYYYGAVFSQWENYDLQALGMGKKQIINIQTSNPLKTTLYVYFFNYDTSPGTVSCSITITDGLTDKLCHPCQNGALSYGVCGCACPTNYQGIDCSRKINYVSSSQPKVLAINQYQLVYFKIGKSGDDVKITLGVFAANGSVEAYASNALYSNSFANYFNVAGVRQETRWILGGGAPTTATATASLKNYEVSITFAKYTSGTSFVSVSYEKTGINILTIVLIVLGVILGVSIIVGIIFLMYRLRANDARIHETNALQVNADRLGAQEIEKYFPQFKRIDLQKGEQKSIQSLNNNNREQVDKQCAICLSPIELTQLSRLTYCKHMFHSGCLVSWFKKQRNCPYCRQQFTKVTTNNLYMQLIRMNGNVVLKDLDLVIAILKSVKPISKISSQPVVQNLQ